MNTPYLQLNSPGGSVIEAVRLGEQIEKSGFMATVQHGDTCASACFLLFISAQFRYMDNSAEILLHRPFISHPRTDLKGYDADRKLQQATTKALRDFLEERSVPSQLIDVMMNYPSNNAHRLTVPELQFGIHSISPTLEELTLARCGLTNENIGNSDRDFDSGSDTDDLHCIRHFTMQLKFDYVRSIIGEERFETEFNALKRRIKQRAK